MIRHRQDSEVAISQPTVESSGLLSPPANTSFPDVRRRFESLLRRIDRVATPALAGTTIAWATVAFVLWLTTDSIPNRWSLRIDDLLWAYCATLIVAVPFSALKPRWHGWFAVLATLVALWLTLAVSHGHYQFSRSPWTDMGLTPMFFIKQGARDMGLLALFTAILWLPIVHVVHSWRKPWSERMKRRNLA